MISMFVLQKMYLGNKLTWTEGYTHTNINAIPILSLQEIYQLHLQVFYNVSVGVTGRDPLLS
jgi:hypothetical protein